MKTTHSKFKTLAALTLASAMGLATTEASAAILLIKTNVTKQASPDSGEPGVPGNGTVDFNGADPGGTEYSFTTSAANQEVLISFHAECTGYELYGGESFPVSSDIYSDSYVKAQVEVNPQGPAGWQDAVPTQIFPYLCSGYGWSYSGIDARINTLPAGTHQVRVKFGSYLDGGYIRAKSLVVQN